MKVKPIILILSAALAGTVLAGCGNTASYEETDGNIADTEVTVEIDAENEKDGAFKEHWFDDLPFFYDEEMDQYFEISTEESSDGTVFNIQNFGQDWEILYLTGYADAYTEGDDGGYTYYDTGNEHSVMTYYPSTNTLVLMVSEGMSYNCSAVDVAYGIDPYGFATEYESWYDTYSGECIMDIRYATYADSGENYYQINIAASGGDTVENMWEMTYGTYDETTNSIVFSDCRYYTLTYYADGTEVEADVYTDGSGSISMDDNCRVYWNDDKEDAGEFLVFENEGYNYENIYGDFDGTWYCSFTEKFNDIDVPQSYTLQIADTVEGLVIVCQYWHDPVLGDPEESTYIISDAVYDSATGITFYLPERYTLTVYDSQGNVAAEYDEAAEWYELDLEYTLTSQDGVLTLYKDGEFVEELYRQD